MYSPYEMFLELILWKWNLDTGLGTLLHRPLLLVTKKHVCVQAAGQVQQAQPMCLQQLEPHPKTQLLGNEVKESQVHTTFKSKFPLSPHSLDT